MPRSLDIECPTCNGLRVTMNDKCPICSGLGKNWNANIGKMVTCGTCNGERKISGRCPTCGGRGTISIPND